MHIETTFKIVFTGEHGFKDGQILVMHLFDMCIRGPSVIYMTVLKHKEELSQILLLTRAR